MYFSQQESGPSHPLWAFNWFNSWRGREEGESVAGEVGQGRENEDVRCQNMNFTVADADQDDFILYPPSNGINNLQRCHLPSAHSAREHAYQLQ